MSSISVYMLVHVLTCFDAEFLCFIQLVDENCSRPDVTTAIHEANYQRKIVPVSVLLEEDGRLSNSAYQNSYRFYTYFRNKKTIILHFLIFANLFLFC